MHRDEAQTPWRGEGGLVPWCTGTLVHWYSGEGEGEGPDNFVVKVVVTVVVTVKMVVTMVVTMSVIVTVVRAGHGSSVVEDHSFVRHSLCLPHCPAAYPAALLRVHLTGCLHVRPSTEVPPIISSMIYCDGLLQILQYFEFERLS